MELYVLDSLLRRTDVVDQYDSLIWTDRFSTAGDFELVTSSTPTARQKFAPGQLLALNLSDRVMQVDSIEDKDDSEGRSLLTIKGPSLEHILGERPARPADNMLAKDPADTNSTELKWIFTDTPANVARAIYNAICGTGVYDPNDVLPFSTAASPKYLPDTNELVDAVVKLAVDLSGTVQSNIESICTSYGLGYRIIRDPDTAQLYFHVYGGRNRTSRQTADPAIIFSQDIGNLNETTFLTTTTGRKNVAYVIAPKGSRKVYIEGTSATVSGFDRRVLLVEASDITLSAGQPLQDALEQRGQEELAKYKPLQGMDGEIQQVSGYLYGRDYNLGDTVEIRNPDGVTTEMQVTEQIFSQDESGEKSYPTLTTSLFITPGSWYSGVGAHTWDDSLGTWDDAAPV